jgi:IS5 family transposase
MVDKLHNLPEELRTTERVLADSGYYSEANVQTCVQAQIEPLLAPKREAHHLHWNERFGEPPPLAQGASAVEKMKHTLNTRAGRAVYALRKQSVEPVFGIIKSVMGFRQFLLRGLDNVRNEWTLVCMAWNLKRMAVLRPNCLQSG